MLIVHQSCIYAVNPLTCNKPSEVKHWFVFVYYISVIQRGRRRAHLFWPGYISLLRGDWGESIIRLHHKPCWPDGSHGTCFIPPYKERCLKDTAVINPKPSLPSLASLHYSNSQLIPDTFSSWVLKGKCFYWKMIAELCVDTAADMKEKWERLREKAAWEVAKLG
jgi:hypothetical protein